MAIMHWRTGTSVRPASGFIEPCIPTVAKAALVGPDWVYEIGHGARRNLAWLSNHDIDESNWRVAPNGFVLFENETIHAVDNNAPEWIGDGGFRLNDITS